MKRTAVTHVYISLSWCTFSYERLCTGFVTFFEPMTIRSRLLSPVRRLGIPCPSSFQMAVRRHRHRRSTSAHQTRYFDVLPLDTLYVLLKFLSSTPYCEDWLTNVKPKDVHTALTLGGVLSIVSREIFTTFNYGSVFRRTRKLRALALVMAPHMERFDLYGRKYRRFDFERLSRLRVLIVNYNSNANLIEQVLVAVGENLLELEIHTFIVRKRLVRNIAQYCKSLKVFNSDDAVYRASSKPIWTALGSTLTEVRGYFPEDDLAYIARYCTRLESVQFFEL